MARRFQPLHRTLDTSLLTWLCILIALFFLPTLVSAKAWGEACDPSPVYTPTHRYQDSCDNIMLACDPSNKTCVYRGCSNQDYLPGWNNAIPLPVRCPQNVSYCPDNNLKCMPLKPLNSSCEPSRDDECEGQHGICLNQICELKVKTLGQPCVVDITEYRRAGYDGEHSIIQKIIRDNCGLGTFCDMGSQTCIQANPLGSRCEQDRECTSGACNDMGFCDKPPDSFREVPTWVYATIGVAVFAFVMLTLLLLWVLHRHHRRTLRAKRARFFEEQEAFRQAAMLPGTAEGNITLSTPNSPMSASFRASKNYSSLSLNSFALNPPAESRTSSPGTSRPASARFSYALMNEVEPSVGVGRQTASMVLNPQQEQQLQQQQQQQQQQPPSRNSMRPPSSFLGGGGSRD
ncbi:uncharacterized protein VTP21DRAFT_9883 [Calcarisporiella thermophila]|uniref:uncharacterized protein n=1 Tax=Calcarisporiella thermophila TaxID=911321 RepID=UPI0037427C4E